MGARITVYPAIWEAGEDFDRDIPEVFTFESKFTTALISGANELGKELFAEFSPEEQRMLIPTGYIYEEQLTPVDSKVLSRVVIRFLNLVYEHLMNQDNPVPSEFKDWSPTRVFDVIQRDIAGAIFICHMAIEKGVKVYWALG